MLLIKKSQLTESTGKTDRQNQKEFHHFHVQRCFKNKDVFQSAGMTFDLVTENSRALLSSSAACDVEYP